MPGRRTGCPNTQGERILIQVFHAPLRLRRVEGGIRFDRQVPLADFGRRGQLSLSRSRAVVVGLGGTGCSAALNLGLAGVGNLVLIDRDVISVENLHRQALYSPQDVGRSKAEVASAFIAGRTSATVEFHALSIDGSNASSLLRGADIVLDCLDNFAARYSVNRACVDGRIPMVHTGSLGWEGSVAVFKSPETACLECLFHDVDDGSLPTCETAGALGATTSTIGSLGAVQAIRLLSGARSPLLGRILVEDFRSAESRSVAVAKRSDCQACGTTKRRKITARARSIVSLCGDGEYYHSGAYGANGLARIELALSRPAGSRQAGVSAVERLGTSLIRLRFRGWEEASLFKGGGILVRGVHSKERATAIVRLVVGLAGPS